MPANRKTLLDKFALPAELTLRNSSMDIVRHGQTAVRCSIPSLKDETFSLRLDVVPEFRRDKHKMFEMKVYVDKKYAGYIRWWPKPGVRRQTFETSTVDNPDRRERRTEPWVQVPMSLGKEVEVYIHYENPETGWTSVKKVFTWLFKETDPKEVDDSSTPETSTVDDSVSPGASSSTPATSPFATSVCEPKSNKPTNHKTPPSVDTRSKRRRDDDDDERGVSVEVPRKRQRLAQKAAVMPSVKCRPTPIPSSQIQTSTSNDAPPPRPRILYDPIRYIVGRDVRAYHQPCAGDSPLGLFCRWLLERRDEPSSRDRAELRAHYDKLKETGLGQYSSSQRELLRLVLNLLVHVEGVAGSVEWEQLARDMLSSFGLRLNTWDQQWAYLRRWWRDNSIWSSWLDWCVKNTLRKHNLI